jgi:hypothetical protein
MQTKTTNCYVEALRALQQLAPAFNPKQVMCDFELMEQNAWSEVYPNAECHGCHFHHVKVVYWQFMSTLNCPLFLTSLRIPVFV